MITSNNMRPKRISVTEALDDWGCTLDEVAFSSTVPACCDDLCEVEPDGYCEHGHPSVLLMSGLI
jgi:hypothetical protein